MPLSLLDKCFEVELLDNWVDVRVKFYKKEKTISPRDCSILHLYQKFKRITAAFYPY